MGKLQISTELYTSAKDLLEALEALNALESFYIHGADDEITQNVKAQKCLVMASRVSEHMKTLRSEINAKEEAKIRREIYSDYKTTDPTASGGQLREHYRQEYLDRVGVPNDYRSTVETTP